MTGPDKDTMARLADELETLNNHRYFRRENSPLRVLVHQFGRGLAFGLGSALGATFLLSILAWWLSQFEFLPVIGEWASQLVDQIEQTRGE